MSNRDSSVWRPARALWVWVVLFAVQVSSVGAAQDETVRELLQKEKLAMLQEKRARQLHADKPIFELMAIWGIEPALSARVRYRGGDIEFRQGRQTALEPYAKRFTLMAIRPPCVLFRFQGAQRKVCLQPEGRP